jgi:hypothetical protein
MNNAVDRRGMIERDGNCTRPCNTCCLEQTGARCVPEHDVMTSPFRLPKTFDLRFARHIGQVAASRANATSQPTRPQPHSNTTDECLTSSERLCPAHRGRKCATSNDDKRDRIVTVTIATDQINSSSARWQNSGLKAPAPKQKTRRAHIA